MACHEPIHIGDRKGHGKKAHTRLVSRGKYIRDEKGRKQMTKP